VYQVGHQGVNLLLFAPVAVVLVVAGYPLVAVGGALVVFTTASLPDADLRLPLVSHRGITHTIWAALASGLAVAVGTWLAVGVLDLSLAALSLTRTTLAAFAGGTVAFSILSHLVGDALTPMGIRPFEPVSEESYSLSVCTADSWLANRLLFGLGVVATSAAVGVLYVL